MFCDTFHRNPSNIHFSCSFQRFVSRDFRPLVFESVYPIYKFTGQIILQHFGSILHCRFRVQVPIFKANNINPYRYFNLTVPLRETRGFQSVFFTSRVSLTPRSQTSNGISKMSKISSKFETTEVEHLVTQIF